MTDRLFSPDDVLRAFRAWVEAWEAAQGESARQATSAIRAFITELEASPVFRALPPGPLPRFCEVGRTLPSWRKVWIPVEKSSFLARVLVGGEAVRTRPCPVHRGAWSGVPTPLSWVKAHAPFDDPFTCGCQGTGWLPEGAPVPETIAFVEGRCSGCGSPNPVDGWGRPPRICLVCDRPEAA